MTNRISIDVRNRLAIIGLAACSGIVGHAQEPLPSFEVATIKASGPSSPTISIRRLPGGRLVTSNTPLAMLIQWAYQLDESRLLGVPKGLDSIRFDVVAKAPEQEPVAGRMQLMMRALLADRFKLVVHHDTKELTAYTLVTDTGGPKVKALNAAGPSDPNPFTMNEPGSLRGRRVTADMLATVLSNHLGRPVRNMTGFSGAFDFTLQWAPDNTVATPDAQDRPSLVTALREQLGFRLVAQKASLDVIVIDHVERTSTEN